MGAQRFTDLRAWQASDLFKKAVFKLCAVGTLSRDSKLREQLEDAAMGPPGHIAEGFGRFNPRDFARFVVMARSSLMEAQNHLHTAVDKGHITEERRREHHQLAEVAVEHATGLVEYLQSPEALQKAREVRERRDARRARRKRQRRNGEPNVEPNGEPYGEPNGEPNIEPNIEPNPEPNQALNSEPNRERGTPNRTANRNTNSERRTGNPER